jgi:hypothetical protein
MFGKTQMTAQEPARSHSAPLMRPMGHRLCNIVNLKEKKPFSFLLDLLGAVAMGL